MLSWLDHLLFLNELLNIPMPSVIALGNLQVMLGQNVRYVYLWEVCFVPLNDVVKLTTC